MAERPRLLIEDWLPIAELGIESRRERAVPMDLPPLFGLHVWWARKPLVASGAVILASLMPSWTANLAAAEPEAPELATEHAYQHWFLRLCGVLGDPVSAKRGLDAANAAGVRLPGNPYGYKPAFKNSPTTPDLDLLRRILVRTWGRVPNVLDPTAGGGSIPYESSRYGLPTTANDLNPVASALLHGGVAYPARFGLDLLPDLKRWGDVLVGRLRARLDAFFPLSDSTERIVAYLFVRLVRCPRTGKQVPLAPSWWLSKKPGSEAALRVVTERAGVELEHPEFEIVRGSAARETNPDRGTLARGDAISPWDNLAISSEYIKAEAREGRLGSHLCAIALRSKGFREPNQDDLDALEEAEREVGRLLPDWERRGMVPVEQVPEGDKTREPRQMGLTRWTDFFSPRQLLVHGTFVEAFQSLAGEVRGGIADEARAQAVISLLALMLGKGITFNSLLSSWHVNRQVVRSVFDQHNFAFKWTFAEFDGGRELYQWALGAGLLRAYEGISRLLLPADSETLGVNQSSAVVPGPVEVTCRTAGDLAGMESDSQSLVCIDPPYYDNVQYAELSDFFYVWEKLALVSVWPEFFQAELTDKKNEAVANTSRYVDAGRRSRELASADYEAKMGAIFSECHRVLSGDGVMAVMFTHKSAEAWDALGLALMQAGFTIETSWPVNTESEQSLHQAKKNAAASTIMLVCRKREADDVGGFFEDLEPEVRAEARRALEAFSAQGISGVDLLLATYGPALSVISSRWPVYSSEADPVTGRSRLLRPEEALDAAREEVTRLQRNRLVGREQSLDPISDFTLVAWDTFKAVEFPFDEARRLALAVGGLDVDELRRAKVLEKKSGTVVLLPPAKRVRRDADLEAGLSGVYPEAMGFTVALDGVHTAIYIADVDGLAAAKAFLDRAGLASDPRFLAALQGLVNAIPRTKIKGEWVVPDAETLDRLSAAYFPDIELPQEPEAPSFEQASLLGEE